MDGPTDGLTDGRTKGAGGGRVVTALPFALKVAGSITVLVPLSDEALPAKHVVMIEIKLPLWLKQTEC